MESRFQSQLDELKAETGLPIDIGHGASPGIVRRISSRDEKRYNSSQE
jgi:hypothetical protein